MKKKKLIKRPGTKAISECIALMERGKEQVNIAQIQEIVCCLADMIFADLGGQIVQGLYLIGRRRAKAKARAKRKAKKK